MRAEEQHTSWPFIVYMQVRAFRQISAEPARITQTLNANHPRVITKKSRARRSRGRKKWAVVETNLGHDR